jgi:aldehyde:ferredoxin oxidoreductase
MAGINVDTYRHFGRLGGGAALGAKNVKAAIIIGDGSFPLTEGKDYPKLFKMVYQQLTATDMMQKYHNLGTPVNVAVLNELKAMPWRNLQATSDPGAAGISGERFAETALLRNAACSGCPVGCIHIGFSRERFQADYRFFYRQVSYDHEPIFAAGSMLGVTDCFAVLDILDVVEQMGLDVMSAGVALAWATEALEKGVVTEHETLLPLKFGDHNTYEQAVRHLAHAPNDFYRLLSQGTLRAAAHYGGAEFACVLGQEMAGYATGEVYFASQALGLRHSHLDAGGYAYDQKHDDQDVGKAVDFLLADEAARAFLTSMVACLFARGVYTEALLGECLAALGYKALAGSIDAVARNIQRLRWQTRFSTGFDPAGVSIPKRFAEVVTWKGRVDGEFLSALQAAYAGRLRDLGTEAPTGGAGGKETG